jgi:V8-like Glu-specific endopeptidase
VLYKCTVWSVISLGYLLPYEETGTDTVDSWTNLLRSNKIYTCDVCGGFSGSPSEKTEAYVSKREVPGLGFG